MNRHIVITADGSVSIDGEVHQVDLRLKPGVHALRWTPGEKPAGFIEQRGDSHGHSDWSLIEPFVEAWEKARAAAKAEAEAKEAEVKAEFEKRKAEAGRQQKEAEEKFQAQQRNWAAYGAALSTLGESDHEVIKAMEAKLVAEGALPDDLVKRRQEARAVAKSEKQRLKAEEAGAVEK